MSAAPDSPIRLGIAGAGGYAQGITDLLLRDGLRFDPPVRLLGIAEPDTALHGRRLEELRGHGLVTPPTLAELLRIRELEAVWLPVPIALHRSFTEQALAAGKAVLCEKPVAGAVQDVDAMIRARDLARRAAIVGYQHVYMPPTLILKQRLLEGVIGPVRRAALHACWPRSEAYYRRNNWAGRCKAGEVWVMDSPANNALAHFVNLALFLLGPTPESSALPLRVEAELYRALPIENYDTIGMRLTLPDGVPLVALLTHACRDFAGPQLLLTGEHGTMLWSYEKIVVTTRAGQESLAGDPNLLQPMVETFARLVRGLPGVATAVATLETARAQVVAINGASEATPIVPVPAREVESFEVEQERCHAIRGIEAACRQCAATGSLFHESGLLPFTRPPGQRELTDYCWFRGPRQT